MSRLRAADREPDEKLVELCAFRVGDEEYVLDIQRIREIIHPLPVTSVPRAPAWMDGVVDVRGEVLPLLDVRRRLGLPPRTATLRAKILVVNVGGRLIGLLVDGVSEVVRIPRSAIGPPPALMPSASGARLFLGVVGAGSPAPIARSGKGLPRPRPAPKRGGVAPARAAPPDRLRLLLNVKALLDPAASFGAGAADLPTRRSSP